MESVPQMAEILTRILNEEADQLARTTGFIQRQRNESGADLAQAMILGYLQEPQVSPEGLTQILQRREVTISAPGLSEHASRAGRRLLCASALALECGAVANRSGGDPLAEALECGDRGGQFLHPLTQCPG